MAELNELAQARLAVRGEVEDREIDPTAVMKAQCKTCPWRNDSGRLNVSNAQMLEIQRQVLTEANQRCHSPAWVGAVETMVCRGARDFQIEYFYCAGVLTAPTDEAWTEAIRKLSPEATS
jgi:hypothetical protein